MASIGIRLRIGKLVLTKSLKQHTRVSTDELLGVLPSSVPDGFDRVLPGGSQQPGHDAVDVRGDWERFDGLQPSAELIY